MPHFTQGREIARPCLRFLSRGTPLFIPVDY